jgi:hypothetical protein
MISARLAQRGEIAYWATTLEADGGEQRRVAREPLRLRSAKLLDAAYRFLCECRICDRSPDGLRLALSRKIALPPDLTVYLDETGEVRGATIVWRRHEIIGLRLRERAPASALRPCDRYALSARYYAMTN